MIVLKVTKKTTTNAEISTSAKTGHTNVEALFQTVFAKILLVATVVNVNMVFFRIAVQQTKYALTKTNVN